MDQLRQSATANRESAERLRSKYDSQASAERTEGPRPAKMIELQSEYARKYTMQTKTSFLENRSNSQDIEISQKVRLPGPLPDPEDEPLRLP